MEASQFRNDRTAPVEQPCQLPALSVVIIMGAVGEELKLYTNPQSPGGMIEW
jgi:hypothetical protein